MLIIDYIDNSNFAHLSMENESLAWGEMRRVCQERGDIHISSDQSLTMPWWAFLSTRKSIRLIAVKYQLTISFSSRVKELLTIANSKRSQFKEIDRIHPVPEEQVLNVLNEVGFQRKLTKHQLRNVAKLASLPAAATFSVPGAGKTTEALAYYFFKKQENSILFIVAPKNAFAAWDEQLNICKPDAQSIVRLTGGERAIEIALRKAPRHMMITYQQLPRVLNLISSYLN
ncbi:ATP-dependent helicase, partial [Paenibacillus sp. 28ISP30-2]|nr:ATP-dependent helicase [Paenibacillus sp. 28ISP30-2]